MTDIGNLPANQSISVVSSLPGAPYDGQEIYYLADATNGMLGYTVTEAFTVDTDTDAGPVAVLYVEGHGVALYVREDDEDAFASLVDPDAHAERATQAKQLEEDQDG